MTALSWKAVLSNWLLKRENSPRRMIGITFRLIPHHPVWCSFVARPTRQAPLHGCVGLETTSGLDPYSEFPSKINLGRHRDQIFIIKINTQVVHNKYLFILLRAALLERLHTSWYKSCSPVMALFKQCQMRDQSVC